MKKKSREDHLDSLPFQNAPQLLGPETVRKCGLASDAARAHQFGQGLLHGHHAFGAADGKLAAELVIRAQMKATHVELKA